MISTSQDMLSALSGKAPRFTGVILYQGPSMLDGAPIVVIANRIVAPSTNSKTGSLVQTFIIRSDVAPLEALKTGQDGSVCGNCPARPANAGFCYVNVGQSVMSVYGAFLRGRYAAPHVDYDPAILADLFEGSIFRLGTYGDPAAAPFAIWEAATAKVKARNGYTHQWRTMPEFKALCMASCDAPGDEAEATAMGWRCFRMRLASDPVAKGEVVCPASKEGGYKTTCDKCRACGGLSSKARANMVIIAHGTAKSVNAYRRYRTAA